ncbi:FAD-dependent oxidoreductase [Halomonas halodenitrificans]|uniref:FAD-dependent oxidoreductase n=1 Tax=Halomonas halodenitrificans TaxID=28252 RepID=UPI00316ACB4B
MTITGGSILLAAGGSVLMAIDTIEVTAELARRHGADIHEFSPISKIDVVSDPVRIMTPTGWEMFDRVVLACGGWSTKLIPHLRKEVVTRRLTSMWFNEFHDGGLAGLPPFLRSAPHYCYGIPSRDCRSIKLGLGFNNHYISGDADRFPRQLEGGELLNELKKFEWIQQEMLPVLSRRPYRTETFVENYTRSMLEYIRTHPQNSNVLIMTGFSGHGFRVSPVMGEIGCQLVVNGKSDMDVSFLEKASPFFSILDPEKGITTDNPVMTNS